MWRHVRCWLRADCERPDFSHHPRGKPSANRSAVSWDLRTVLENQPRVCRHHRNLSSRPSLITSGTIDHIRAILCSNLLRYVIQLNTLSRSCHPRGGVWRRWQSTSKKQLSNDRTLHIRTCSWRQRAPYAEWHRNLRCSSRSLCSRSPSSDILRAPGCCR